MDLSFLYQINYLAVLVSSIIFFMIGSFWFSLLFGSIWAKELESHGIKIKEPSKGELTTKMLVTFLSNLVTSFAIACLVIITSSSTITSGLILGIITSIGLAATSIATIFTWESRSLKLFLIDWGYPAVGILTSSIILSLWQ